MVEINLSYFLPCTENEGPGKRAAIWVQGCHFNCPGCCNPELQPFRIAKIVNVNDLLERIITSVSIYKIEGITLLGGEPLLQAKGLSILAKECKRIGLSVMVFTGFKLSLLKQKPVPGSDSLLSYTDVLVDGLYKDNQKEDTRNWCGSKNQIFHYLTDRYGPEIEVNPEFEPVIEVSVTNDLVRISGYPL